MEAEQQEQVKRIYDGPIGVPDLGLLARLVAYEDGNFGVQVRLEIEDKVDWGVMSDAMGGPTSRYATMAEARSFYQLLRRLPEIKEAMGLTKDHGIHAFVHSRGMHNSNYIRASLEVWSVCKIGGKFARAIAVIDKDTGLDVETNEYRKQ